MTTSQNLRLLSRRRMAGVLAACCLAFIPSLHAAVTVETFTDYQAFLSLLGPTAQVVNFDDVPLTPFPDDPSQGYAYLDPNRYASQGIGIYATDGRGTVIGGDGNNAFVSTFAPGAPSQPPATTREGAGVGFSAPTVAFGTFFLGAYRIDDAGDAGQVFNASGSFGQYFVRPTLPPLGSRDLFLGLAALDSVTGQLVPAITGVDIGLGIGNVPAYLDNLTFATPGEVPPVPEANAWALFAGVALAGIGLYRRRARATA